MKASGDSCHQPLFLTQTQMQKCSSRLLTLITVDLTSVTLKAPPPALGTNNRLILQSASQSKLAAVSECFLL